MHQSSNLSRSQIDHLGDRLRKGNVSQDDLRLLDSYRLFFGDAYKEVVAAIRRLAPTFEGKSLVEPTGREAKSTASIIAKLQRESIRLSQMQDIAGCRITVEDLDRQDYIVGKIAGLFEKASVIDRREQPSHGYRAVHVIVDYDAKLIEIQVRTHLQHLWAELSEKLSDLVDNSIKYGGGPVELATPLANLSERIANVERTESILQALSEDDAKIRSLMESGRLSDELKQDGVLLTRNIDSIRKRHLEERRAVTETVNTLLVEIEELE